ncbi:unnamed protein product [Diamesa tonsa]
MRKSELACQRYQHLRENFQTEKQKCSGPHNLISGYSDINEFPHMAAIGYHSDKDNTSFVFLCSGSLISEKFVLTAARCLKIMNQVPRIVRLGKTTLHGGDCKEAIDVNVLFDSGKIHKDYNLTSGHNDIALLELEKSVEQFFNTSLLPACLHYGLERITRNLTVTSWQLFATFDEFQAINNWLVKAELQEVPIAHCKRGFKRNSIAIVQSQLCTLSPTQDNCKGDSGGPLQYKLNDTYYLAGVGAFIPFCGANYPQIYARVSYYIDWIENIVWP